MDGTGRNDPANPHPHGKVPALKDGDDIIFETSAITVYLTDKYRQKKLGPLSGSRSGASTCPGWPIGRA